MNLIPVVNNYNKFFSTKLYKILNLNIIIKLKYLIILLLYQTKKIIKATFLPI